jgi:hypothetical protein
VTSVGRSMPEGGSPRGTDPVLRAKYLDFCSARVAEVLLALSPDEMFVLAEDAARASGEDLGGARPGYDEIVRLATERLSRQLGLPSFEAFVEAYRRDPEAFDREMLGLWQSGAGPE